MSLKQLCLRFCAWLVHGRGAVDWVVGALEPSRNTSGALSFPYVQKKRDRNVQILIYHRVNDENDEMFPGLPSAQFAAQMELLATKWRVCSLTEVLEQMRCNDVPDKAVVVTFDDGYRDNYVHAFPLLKRLNIPATIFLATGVIGTSAMLWHDRVFQIFRESTVEHLKGFPKPHDLFDLGTRSGRRSAQGAALQLLWELSPPQRSIEIDRLSRHLGVEANDSTVRLMLDWNEVREMRDFGIEFGSHTVTHPIMSKITREQAVVELHASKEKIESELHVPVHYFAYPVGRQQDFSGESKALVRDAGYKCALTTIPGTNTCRHDRLELRRMTPWDKDIKVFGMRLKYWKFAT